MSLPTQRQPSLTHRVATPEELALLGCTRFKRGVPSEREKQAHTEKLGNYLYLVTLDQSIFMKDPTARIKAVEDFQRGPNILQYWNTVNIEAPGQDQDPDAYLRALDVEIERLSAKPEHDMTIADRVARAMISGAALLSYSRYKVQFAYMDHGNVMTEIILRAHEIHRERAKDILEAGRLERAARAASRTSRNRMQCTSQLSSTSQLPCESTSQLDSNPLTPPSNLSAQSSPVAHAGPSESPLPPSFIESAVIIPQLLRNKRFRCNYPHEPSAGGVWKLKTFSADPEGVKVTSYIWFEDVEAVVPMDEDEMRSLLTASVELLQ